MLIGLFMVLSINTAKTVKMQSAILDIITTIPLFFIMSLLLFS